MKTGLLVRDAMSANPVHCAEDWSIEKAVSKMISEEVGSLVVKEGDFLKGIITESDLIKKVLSEKKKPGQTKVSEIMSSDVITIKPTEDVTDAMRKMAEEKVRRLPVVDEGKLVGIITVKDIVKIQPDLIDLLYRKREDKEELDIIGECENCHAQNVSLKEVGEQLLCQDCR